jgi:hypothetical protein
MPHYNIQHMRASGSFATVFDFFATRHSSRLWILFANCESVSVVIAPRGRGKEKMEGDLSGTPYIQLGPDVNRNGVCTRGRDLRFENCLCEVRITEGYNICNQVKINHNGQEKKKTFGCCHFWGRCAVDPIPERYW